MRDYGEKEVQQLRVHLLAVKRRRILSFVLAVVGLSAVLLTWPSFVYEKAVYIHRETGSQMFELRLFRFPLRKEINYSIVATCSNVDLSSREASWMQSASLSLNSRRSSGFSTEASSLILQATSILESSPANHRVKCLHSKQLAYALSQGDLNQLKMLIEQLLEKELGGSKPLAE